MENVIFYVAFVILIWQLLV